MEPPPAIISTFNDNFEVWLKVNNASAVLHKSTVRWGTLFLFAIWSLWKNRNKVIFGNSIPNPNLHKACIHQVREYFYCVSKIFQATRKVAIQVRWNKPPEGWFKLNTDGASHGNPGKVGGGGIIRNSHGFWIKGYSRSIGYTTSVIAE